MAPKKVLSAKKQKGFSDAGYSPALREFIENLELPDEIICAICHQPHSQEHYSKGQLLSLRQALYSQGDPVLIEQRVAKCPACCSAAAAERKCRFCGQWKSIDNFARTQRILEQPACKKCQDYYQESAFALGLPAPIDDSLIEAEDEQNNQLLLLSNEDGSSHDSSNNETMIGSSSEAHGVDNDVDGDGDDESIQPIVTLIDVGEMESPMSRASQLVAAPSRNSGFLKVRRHRPANLEVTIAPPEAPHDGDSDDGCSADMDAWRYL